MKWALEETRWIEDSCRDELQLAPSGTYFYSGWSAYAKKKSSRSKYSSAEACVVDVYPTGGWVTRWMMPGSSGGECFDGLFRIKIRFLFICICVLFSCCSQ